MATAPAELGRKVKPGTLRHSSLQGQGRGTPAPNEGFAFSLAQHILEQRRFAHEHDRADVMTGIALVAAKIASRAHRGPSASDVHTALEHFGIATAGTITSKQAAPFAGLAHDYFAQRRFVDAVDLN